MYLMSSMSANFGNMAMVNYPYPANLVAPLPGNPVSVGVKNAAGTKH